MLIPHFCIIFKQYNGNPTHKMTRNQKKNRANSNKNNSGRLWERNEIMYLLLASGNCCENIINNFIVTQVLCL